MNEKIEKIAFVLFLVLVASLSIQKPSLFYVSGLSTTLTDIVFPVAGSFYLICILLNRSSFRFDKVYFFFAAYLAAFAIATIFSPQFTRSAFKALATGYLVAMGVLSFNAIDSEDRARQIFRIWLFASILPLLVGLFTIALFYISPANWLLPYLTYHYGAVPVGNYPRLSSTFVSASMFCNFLNVELMLLLAAQHKHWISEGFFWSIFTATIVCAMFTISSGLGALFLAVGIWIWFSSSNVRIRRVALVSGIAICFASLAASFVALQPHSTATYSVHLPIVNADLFPSSRLLVWSDSIQRFLEHPIFGNGPGMPSASVTFENTEGGFSILTDAHNAYLSVATQTGIFGLTALIALTIYLIRLGFKNIQNDPVQIGVAIAFLTAFVVQGLTGAFEDARHLWVVIGLLVAVAKFEVQNESTAQVGGGT